MYIFLLARNSDCCSWFVAISDLYYTVYNKFNKFLPSTVLQQCCGGICISHDQSPGSGPSPPKPGPSPHDGPGLRCCEALARQSPAQARAFEPGPSPDITTHCSRVRNGCKKFATLSGTLFQDVTSRFRIPRMSTLSRLRENSFAVLTNPAVMTPSICASLVQDDIAASCVRGTGSRLQGQRSIRTVTPRPSTAAGCFVFKGLRRAMIHSNFYDHAI